MGFPRMKCGVNPSYNSGFHPLRGTDRRCEADMRTILFTAAIAAGLPGAAMAQVLAQVGGVSITLQQVVAADPAAAKDRSARDKVLLTLINRQAVLNAADKTGIKNSPAYKRALKEAGENLTIQLMAQQFTATHPLSDREIEDGYQKVAGALPKEQYRLREITTDSYPAADAAIAEIKGGKSFSIVAAERSQDPQTAALGGETGWVAAPQLLAPILKAIEPLKVGEVTGPVAVPKGFAVLQLLGKRATPKPPLDQIKPQLTAALQQQQWDKYVIRLRTEQGAHLVVPLPEK
jgi:peptidyl-prolyl cis-trans isomerase C